MFVVTVVNYVPFQELSSLSCLLQPKPSATTVSLIFQTVSKLVNFDKKYKQILQEAGLLHMLLTLLKQYHSQLSDVLNDPPVLQWKGLDLLNNQIEIEEEDSQTKQIQIKKASNSFEQPSIAIYTVAMDCIGLLLHGVPENIYIFRTSGCAVLLYSLLYNQDTRTIALRILQELIEDDKLQQFNDIDVFIELMLVSPNGNFQMKQDILLTLQKCFQINERTKDSFRESGGFMCLTQLLVGVQQQDELSLLSQALSPPPQSYIQAQKVESGPPAPLSSSLLSEDEKNKLQCKISFINTIFRTITVAISSHARNRKYFRESIAKNLGKVLQFSNILHFLKSFEIFDSLLCIATENVNTLWEPEKLLIYNPEILLVIFQLFPTTPMEVQIAILKRIHQIISIGRRNQEPLCSIGLLDFIFTNFEKILLDSTNPLQVLLLSFIEELARHRISPLELRKFIGFMKEKQSSNQLLSSLLRMVKQGCSPPFVEFDMQRLGYACLHLLSFGERSWPPTNGYTFLCWLYIDTFDASHRLDLFTFISDDNKSVTTASIKNGCLLLQTSQKSVSEFPYDFQLKKWYHIAIVHTRFKFQTSEAKLYVNGELVNTVKTPYITATSTSVGAYIGTPPSKQYINDLVWRIGPCYLIEDAFNWDNVLVAYCLGVRYCSNFQATSFSSYSNYSMINSRTLSIVQNNLPITTVNNMNNNTSLSSTSNDQLLQPNYASIGPLDLSNSTFNLPEEKIIFSLNAINTTNLNRYHLDEYDHYGQLSSIHTNNANNPSSTSTNQPNTLVSSGNLPISNAGGSSNTVNNNTVQGNTIAAIPMLHHDSNNSLNDANLPGVPGGIAGSGNGANNGTGMDNMIMNENKLSSGMVILNSVASYNTSSKALMLGGCLSLASSGIFTGINKIGGVGVIFLLIEKADTSESLYEAISLLTILLQENDRFIHHMELVKGYAMLASFLHNKQSLLTKKILDKLFELTGIYGREGDPVISNLQSCRHLILYYQLWKWTSPDIQILYFRRLNHLLINNSQASYNVNKLHRLHLLQKILIILQDDLLDESLLDWIGNLLTNFLAHQITEDDLHSLTTFLITTLDEGTKKPTTLNKRRTRAYSSKKSGNVSSVNLNTSPSINKQVANVSSASNTSNKSSGNIAAHHHHHHSTLPRNVKIRNMVLEVIANLIIKSVMNTQLSLLFMKVITPNWIFYFIDRYLHPSTVTIGLKILITLLQSKSNFHNKFQSIGGFDVLQDILPKYADCSSIYYLLISLLIGKSPGDLPVDLSSLKMNYSDLFIIFKSPEFHISCVEAFDVLLAVLKKSCAGCNESTIPFTYVNFFVPVSLRDKQSSSLASSPPSTSSNNDPSSLASNDSTLPLSVSPPPFVISFCFSHFIYA